LSNYKKKTNDISYQNDCLINFQEHSEIISSKKIKKSEYVTTVETLKRKKERISNKVKEKTQKMIEKSKYTFIEKDKNYLSNINSDTLNILDKKNIDHNIITSYYINEGKDRNDQKIEYKHRPRIRNSKVIKKTNRLSGYKINLEEERTIGKRNRKNIHKRKSNTSIQNFNKSIQTVVRRDVTIGETISIIDLANKMAVKSVIIIKEIMKLGIMVTINQTINQKIAKLIIESMGHKVIIHKENELEESVVNNRNNNFLMSIESRAPIVTIMGHVDHGKTSLLDYIRSTTVTSNEAGGITQHIGAYHVKIGDNSITFLDTPGHEAFTAMRARGVNITDIVVLVIAADDGVMPQTIEAIQHAKAAAVPIIVAINKIDKLESNPDQIKNTLSKYEIIPEEWGGENQFVYISAKSGFGINDLLNSILLQAEILELKAPKNGMASGIVIESFLDKGRGPVARILIREGTLNRGDIVLCGFVYGRVRSMYNEIGCSISLAGPSIPVEILGLSGIPITGDIITVVQDEKKAREVAIYRQEKTREIKLVNQQKLKLENITINKEKNDISKVLNIVLKSDVLGSSEAIVGALKNLSTDEIEIKIVGSGVGRITETDVTLALVSNAILLGFNVRADTSAKRMIESENLYLHYYSVIYDLINKVKEIINGMLIPGYTQKIIGLAEIRNVFRSSKFGVVAGCMVLQGIIKRYNKIRILRDDIVIYEGELESLRRFKNDVNEVKNGIECGIIVKNYNDVCIGDKIEISENIKIHSVS